MLRMVPSWYSLIWYLGYRTQEIPVKGNRVINVSLKENDEVLDEVVVVGYAVGSKRTVSGAVDRIKKEDMNKGVVTSPAEALKGKVAGVIISQAGGDPTSSQASVFVEPLLFQVVTTR